MNTYKGGQPSEDLCLPGVGVLLVNLGTPDLPTAPALRRFLREFLGDPRVIEEPRWKWWPILNFLILPFRPRQSAALYRKIWREDGSPLLIHTLSLAERITCALNQSPSFPVHVAVGMRYGQPSIGEALGELQEKDCTKLLILPMFPQYSGTTVGSVFDAVVAELTSWRVVPSLRTVHRYHDEPTYIEALARSIRQVWESDGETEKLLFSFHGIPLRYAIDGDPYPHECHETARLVAQRLHLGDEQYDVSFQSIFGSEEWVKPPTDALIRGLARDGVRSIDVVCPGFAVDCLETLEEIDQLNRGFFLDNGGERFRYLPCLNDRFEHAQMLASLIRRNLQGWVDDV